MTRLDSRQEENVRPSLQTKGKTPYVEVYLYIRPLVYLSIFNVVPEPMTL
jgi:hypothetical protein